MTSYLKRYCWFALLLPALGCGEQSSASQDQSQGKRPAVQVAAAPKAQQATPAPAAVPSAKGDRLHQPFAEAATDEAPEDQKLPERTKNNLSVGKLYETVLQSWDDIKFVSHDGHKKRFTATIKTDLGDAVIELWPQVAPNHVRNFVALARAGYYNGLEFDRTYNDTTEDQSFQCIVGGCPEATGEVGLGSIGYWMIPELSDTVKHEAGTVGAWHEPGLVETGACKFYITMSKAPMLDGEYSAFGKVTQGLDVLRNVWSRPVEQNVLKNRPLQPVVIRSVTVQETWGSMDP